DVMGAIRGAPVELVKCETVDLYVPATAEIVIEGYLGLDPATYMMEGPYAEFTGYLAGDRSPSPPSASPPSPTATIRSCAVRSKARCPAAIPRMPCARRSCARPPRGTCSTALACRA